MLVLETEALFGIIGGIFKGVRKAASAILGGASHAVSGTLGGVNDISGLRKCVRLGRYERSTAGRGCREDAHSGIENRFKKDVGSTGTGEEDGYG